MAGGFLGPGIRTDILRLPGVTWSRGPREGREVKAVFLFASLSSQPIVMFLFPRAQRRSMWFLDWPCQARCGPYSSKTFWSCHKPKPWGPLLTCTVPPGPGWSLCFRSGSNAVPFTDVGDAWLWRFSSYFSPFRTDLLDGISHVWAATLNNRVGVRSFTSTPHAAAATINCSLSSNLHNFKLF